MTRYTGVHLTRPRKIIPGVGRLLKFTKVSDKAKLGLRWFDWYLAHGENARLACRHFGITPDTFYRWKKRFKPSCPSALEEHSRKPHEFRRSTVPLTTIDLIVSLRKTDRGLSKYKLNQILKRDYGLNLSSSTVGRILADKGLIKEAQLSREIKRRKKINYVIPRLRASRQMRYQHPGFLIQIDTKHLIVLGQTFYQFTAVDCFTKIGFSKVYRSISLACGKDFLESVINFFPFKIKSIQTDNGSEYLLYFHQTCNQHQITHYFSHPRTPKDNALIERLIQTTEYELWLFDETLIPDLNYLNQRLTGWFGRYNTYRPHQSLNYLTPMDYYLNQQKGEKVYGM